MPTNSPTINPPVVWIGVHKLFVDHEVNTRPLRQSRVDELARDFDPDLVGVIHVSPREKGMYAIIDGQHRVEAVRQALGADQNVPCWVHQRIRTAKQASLFVGLNNASKVPPLYQFLGRVNANQPQAVAIHDIVTAAGLKFETTSRDGTIRCVASVEKIYDGGGDAGVGAKVLAQTLRVVIDAWGPTPAALAGSLVEGIGLLLLRYGDQVDLEALTSKLSSSKGGPTAIVGQARTLRDWRGGTVSRAVAGTVVNIYNKGRRTGALGDWWA